MIKPLLGHERWCNCYKCVKRREKARKATAAWVKRQRLAKQDQMRAERVEDERKVKAVLLEYGIKAMGRLEEYYLKNKQELTEINGSVSPIDIRKQFTNQEGKCHVTGRTLKLTGDWNYMDAPRVTRNNPLDSWGPDNIRLVSIYAQRYVIDPGWGGTLDDFKAQLGKGRE